MPATEGRARKPQRSAAAGEHRTGEHASAAVPAVAGRLTTVHEKATG